MNARVHTHILLATQQLASGDETPFPSFLSLFGDPLPPLTPAKDHDSKIIRDLFLDETSFLMLHTLSHLLFYAFPCASWLYWIHRCIFVSSAGYQLRLLAVRPRYLMHHYDNIVTWVFYPRKASCLTSAIYYRSRWLEGAVLSLLRPCLKLPLWFGSLIT
ncbi:hypothetical protein M426DRAFT_145201 [Hypoxylon sp. CI-4A]|nr:hypothetical protein M426DRAFT_145201 [Hypoxylon sp. CI-4A]